MGDDVILHDRVHRKRIAPQIAPFERDSLGLLWGFTFISVVNSVFSHTNNVVWNNTVKTKIK